jgi:UDP-N-acetylmuramate dehydrogenase
MSVLAKYLLRESLSGFEFASGIPGSLGGAVFMNAGAYGGELKDILVSATAVSRDGSEIREFTAEELQLSYRHSALEDNGYIAVAAKLQLTSGNPEGIQAKMRELLEKRNSKQPVQYPSAGSTFKRPTGFFAGALIEEAGLKGKSIGGAQVSEKHAGFIINTGNATTEDICKLISFVTEEVYKKHNVILEPEVKYWD